MESAGGPHMMAQQHAILGLHARGFNRRAWLRRCVMDGVRCRLMRWRLGILSRQVQLDFRARADPGVDGLKSKSRDTR